MYGEDHPWVNRYVKAQYGDDPSVWRFSRHLFGLHFHIVQDTQLIPGYPLIIGQDFGRNPWSLICQPDHMGRLLVHEEVPATNIGLEKHVLQNLKPRLLSNRYIQFKVAVVGDPAGIAKDSHSEETSFELIKRLGLPAFPAPTNEIDARLRAVEALLGRQTNGGPTLLINGPGCPMLCRAMSGGYRFAKAKQGGPQAEAGKARRRRLLARRGRAPIRRADRPWQHGQLSLRLGSSSGAGRKPRPPSSLGWT